MLEAHAVRKNLHGKCNIFNEHVHLEKHIAKEGAVKLTSLDRQRNFEKERQLDRTTMTTSSLVEV